MLPTISNRYAREYANTYASAYVPMYPPANTLLKEVSFIFSRDDGMLEQTTLDRSIEIKRSLAIRALRRSNIRRKVTEYLCEIHPNCSYTSEIAYHIGATSSNVIGALRGIELRYREEESLIGLHLVEERNGGKNVRLYHITDFGKEIMQTMKGRR